MVNKNKSAKQTKRSHYRDGKSNWRRVQEQSYDKTLHGRDVYENQQLDRSEIPKKQTMTSRTIVALLAGVLSAILLYVLIAYFCNVVDNFKHINTNNAYDITNTDTSNVYDGILYKDENLEDIKAKFGFDVFGNPYRYQDADGNVGYLNEQGDIIAWTLQNSEYALFDMERGKWVDSDASKLLKQEEATAQQQATNENMRSMRSRGSWHVGLSAMAGFVVFSLLFQFLRKNLAAQNALATTEDINQYMDDQHIALPEEIQNKFDWFPDVGAHCSVQVSSMISHMAIMNKGIKTIQLAKRYLDDVYGKKSGKLLHLKGEIKCDADGNPLTVDKPLFDIEFSNALFKTSGVPENMIQRYDATQIPYNPNNGNRDKLSGYDTVADMINGDWEFPLYEVQRPSGAYLVDTAPVNTMV